LIINSCPLRVISLLNISQILNLYYFLHLFPLNKILHVALPQPLTEYLGLSKNLFRFPSKQIIPLPTSHPHFNLFVTFVIPKLTKRFFFGSFSSSRGLYLNVRRFIYGIFSPFPHLKMLFICNCSHTTS